MQGLLQQVISGVATGGSFASLARCANRVNYSPSYAFNSLGFRCVRGL